MFKTIFGKIMVLFMAIIMISLYISGVMMSQMMRQSYQENSESELLSIAKDVGTYIDFYNANTIDEKKLEQTIRSKIVDRQDHIWWVHDAANGRKVFKYDPPTTSPTVTNEDIVGMMNEMLSGESLTKLNEGRPITEFSESDTTFGSSSVTVTYPILNSETGNIYVFVSRSLSSLNVQLSNIYRQIVLSIAIAGILAIVVTYVFTRYLLRPLSVVTMGAKQLARGHFDIRLEVRSEDEIGQLANTFNTVATDLKKYEETKDSFIANVSHELRSPLTSMQGLIQGVIDGTIPQDECLHYLGIVLDETKRMNTLVTNMLNLAKMESGQFPLQLEQIDVNELLRRALITFETKIDVKNLMVEVEFEHDREPAMADINQIMQVIQNIMDNAIKFADYGGRLRISTMTNNGSVYISINNSGDPIPRSDIPYLFDRFYKGDKSHTRTREGTGIGLSIVKKILEEHRQKIWVESDRIGGTSFTFTLTRPQVEAPRKGKPEKV